jgi:hypothetical protein
MYETTFSVNSVTSASGGLAPIAERMASTAGFGLPR